MKQQRNHTYNSYEMNVHDSKSSQKACMLAFKKLSCENYDQKLNKKNKNSSDPDFEHGRLVLQTLRRNRLH